jgi:hypothetical protein
MKHASFFSVACLIAVGMAQPAAAAQIATGTVTVANLYIPIVDLTSSPATYSAMFGNTFQVLGTGAFASLTGMTGFQNGTLQFSSMVGTTINQTVADFFVFSDGRGGTYNFTPTSVTTQAYSVTPGVTSSISLFLLGNTLNTGLGFDATPTSLTMSLNSTGASAFSASSTLSIPPVAAVVPEPETWATMLVGFLMIGGIVRYRRRSTRIAYA